MNKGSSGESVPFGEAVTADQYAILLIKPDAIERGLERDLLGMISGDGLDIVCRHRLMTDAGLIGRLFPQTAGDNLIERTIRGYQYEGKLTELVLVSGRGAVDRALDLRKRARARWARGPFENVVHAADDGAEWAYQLRQLAPRCPTCGPVASLNTAPYKSELLPISLSGDIRESAEFRALLRRLWHDRDSVIWKSAPIPPYVASARARDATHSAILIDDNPHATLDNSAAGILRAIPGASVEFAVQSVFAAVHVERYQLAVGPAGSIHSIVGTMTSLGLYADVERR